MGNNEQNIEPHKWKPGQSGNPKGRPRKSFTSITSDMRAKGVEPLTKSGYIEALELIFNSTEKELKEIVKNPKTPYGLKLMIKELNSTSSRSKALADYRDYMFGKATDNKNIEVTEVVRKIGYGDSDTP
jgi:hypothetical protein